MSAILSVDDLNDFISPGVACIKPVETLPKQTPAEAYEVTIEDKIPKDNIPPAQISLTDCLACSGCVTSAEAVLVSLQSHAEVLHALDSLPSIDYSYLKNNHGAEGQDGKLFVASVSPQVRATLAATYGVSETQAKWMIDQLLGGPQGLASGGKYGNGFTWIVDTNAMREANLVLGADEVMESISTADIQVTGNNDSHSTIPKRPILSSACPGWICYAEKTHPHVLPHLSHLKSPQALTGTLLKTVLSERFKIRPDQIWHVSVMPCFDKKLEASREELTDIYWRPPSTGSSQQPVRDVDCVITARELVMLADTRDINFPDLPRRPLSSQIPFPDPTISAFFSPKKHRSQTPEAGTSGGYLHHILHNQLAVHPGSILTSARGRNADVIEYTITSPTSPTPIFKAARYYGFRNIQNLVRKLKPMKKTRLPGGRGQAAKTGGGMDFSYVEVMACPGGCTNGGGQMKIDDIPLKPEQTMTQKEWLNKVDEAYYSMSENDDDDTENENRNANTIIDPTHTEPLDLVNGISPSYVKNFLHHWASSTGIALEKLVMTSYRQVESDVGKSAGADNERVVELAGKIGGGW